MSYTLSKYRSTGWKKANRTDTISSTNDFLTSAELTDIVNEGRREIWNLLIDLDENFGVTTSDITTHDGTVLYNLPSDCRKINSVKRIDGGYNYPLILDKNCVNYKDDKSLYGNLTRYSKQGKQLKVVSSVNGTVQVIYLQDITEFVDVTDDSTAEPNLPIYAQPAIVSYVAREVKLLENDKEGYAIFDNRYQREYEDIRINAKEHLEPTLITGD
jgi:hypothetical protein